MSCTIPLRASRVHLFNIYWARSELIFIKSRTFRAWPHNIPILLNYPELHVLVWSEGSQVTLYSFSRVKFSSRLSIATRYSFSHSNAVVHATIDLSYSPWKASKICGVYSLLAWINIGVLILILGKFFSWFKFRLQFFLSFIFHNPFKMLKKSDYIKIRFEMSL